MRGDSDLVLRSSGANDGRPLEPTASKESDYVVGMVGVNFHYKAELLREQRAKNGDLGIYSIKISCVRYRVCRSMHSSSAYPHRRASQLASQCSDRSFQQTPFLYPPSEQHIVFSPSELSLCHTEQGRDETTIASIMSGKYLTMIEQFLHRKERSLQLVHFLDVWHFIRRLIKHLC